MIRILLALLLLVPLTEVVAQEMALLDPGDHVRVWRPWPFDFWVEGTVIRVTGDTVVVKDRAYQTTLVLPLKAVERLEVRRGEGMLRKHWEPVPILTSFLVNPGTRIRLRETALSELRDSWLVGTAVAMDADSLVMKVDGRGGVVSIPRAALSELHVSRGKSRDKGVILGAAIGFVGGNLYHKVINPPEYQCIAEKNGGDCNSVFFFFSDGSSGVLFGALAGLLFAEERWESVPLPLHMGFTPQGRGEIALRFDFGK